MDKPIIFIQTRLVKMKPAVPVLMKKIFANFMFDKIHCRVAAGLRIKLFRFYRKVMQRPGFRVVATLTGAVSLVDGSRLASGAAFNVTCAVSLRP
jgi:hypothetical protein